jgi:hypothetical protein
MAKNKKQNFWLLAIVFTGITITALYIERNTQRGPDAVMMNQSMGNMMKSEHLRNITMAQLLCNNPQETMMGNESDHSSHHGEMDQMLSGIHRVTTLLIFTCIPFILGGTAFLFVIWIK